MKKFLCMIAGVAIVTAAAFVFTDRAEGCGTPGATCPMMNKMAKSSGLISIEEARLPGAGGEEAKLYWNRCSTCHDLPDPASHDAWQWTHVMERMDRNIRVMTSGQMGGAVMEIPWDGEMKASILDYLQANAFEGADAATIPKEPAAGAASFKARCVECHTLPEPSMHTSEAWPFVVSKMIQLQKLMDQPVLF
jgi:cytochrome c2